ncbi:MAG: sigma-70 family RNA polymerase sigma factor [Lachnospiraceae bacterium]|nr:sigma-70 family RNA polymerase sigma factor [Lachnospiraceae bacterium]
MTDEQFNAAMERLRNKDRQALREIYEAYISFIFHVVLDIVKNRETAEDITSDFFIKLWERSGQYKEGSGHRGYLATIARNMAIDHIRKHKHEWDMGTVLLSHGESGGDSSGGTHGTEEPSLYLASPEPTPEEQTVSDLSVSQALEKLKPVYRQIVTMKVLGDMTFKEIAQALDMPMGTVTWNYQDAIKQLRRFGYE